MKPKIVSRPAFRVVGLKYRGKNENNEIPQLWQTIGPRVREIKNMADDHVAYGISANMDENTGEFDYVAGFEVSSSEEIPEGMVCFEVPGGRYAVFRLRCPRSARRSTMPTTLGCLSPATSQRAVPSSSSMTSGSTRRIPSQSSICTYRSNEE